jgi:hypothetical protein
MQMALYRIDNGTLQTLHARCVTVKYELKPLQAKWLNTAMRHYCDSTLQCSDHNTEHTRVNALQIQHHCSGAHLLKVCPALANERISLRALSASC